jgi:hypothetical protein
MFAADKNPGRSGARVCLVGAVLVLVVPMQEVGVAGLFVGGVDGHLRGTRPLQIEDAVATDQAWHRISPTTAQNVPTEDRPLPKESVSGLVVGVNVRRETAGMPALCGGPD